MAGTDADEFARKDFPLSFRGFDQGEVRAYLGQLAHEIAAGRERESALEARIAELESAPPADLDEAALEAALGREATRVLHAAREAAAEIRAKAAEEAGAARAEADAALRRATDAAEEAAAAIRADAEARAAATIEAAQATREQLRGEIDALVAARDRLVASFDGVRLALDTALAGVHVAADAASAPPVPGDLSAPEHVPTEHGAEGHVDEPAAEPDPGPEPGAQPAPPPPAPEADEDGGPPFRSSSVRVLRPGGTPVAPPIDDDVEGARVPEPVEDRVEVEPAVREAAPPVEDLFARLRADRAEKVASAEALLAAPPRPVPQADLEPERGDDLEPDLAVLSARDDAVGDAERALVRSLKRAFADEQNEVLDALRRLKGRPVIEAVLPDAEVHDARYAAVLDVAATVAADTAGDGAAGSEVAAEHGRSLATDLRARVGRAIDDAGGDVETVAEAISAVYREWKTARVEPLARDLVTAGYAAGTYAATTGDLRWVVDPAEGGCPDCDDNALAGPTPKGSPFPTGQVRPPAHAGCRCLAVPAR